MNRVQLFAIANVLALFMVGWTWLEHGAATSRLDEAAKRLERCAVIGREIRGIRSETEEAIVVEPETFDPTDSVVAAAKEVGLYRNDFFVSETSIGRVDDTLIQPHRINLPKYTITLEQAVKLMVKLADQPTRFQVGSVNFQKLPDNNPRTKNDAELWSVNFTDVIYLKSTR